MRRVGDASKELQGGLTERQVRSPFPPLQLCHNVLESTFGEIFRLASSLLFLRRWQCNDTYWEVHVTVAAVAPAAAAEP